MPYATTLKYEVKIEKGAPSDPVEHKTEIDAYLPITITVPAKPAMREEVGNGKTTPLATEICLEAGKRERLKFLLISASDYGDQNCTKNPVSLLLQFGKEGAHDWDDAPNAEVIWLRGPLVFTDYTLAMLPEKVETIYVQNHRGKDVDLKILVGKSFAKPPKMPIYLGTEMASESTPQRGGGRGAHMAAR